jgi:hypothetical protein
MIIRYASSVGALIGMDQSVALVYSGMVACSARITAILRRVAVDGAVRRPREPCPKSTGKASRLPREQRITPVSVGEVQSQNRTDMTAHPPREGFPRPRNPLLTSTIIYPS